jgi:hypothetical protein
MHESEYAHHLGGDVWFDPDLPMLDASVADRSDQQV